MSERYVRCFIVGLLALLMITGLPGSIVYAQASPISPSTYKQNLSNNKVETNGNGDYAYAPRDVESPIRINVTGKVIGEREAEITSILTTYIGVQDVVVQTCLPNGVERINGDLVWQGNLAAGASVVLKTQVRFLALKNCSITTIAELKQSRLKRSNSIYVLFSSDGRLTITGEPQIPREMPIPVEAVKLTTTSSGSLTAAAENSSDAFVTIQGTCTYFDDVTGAGIPGIIPSQPPVDITIKWAVVKLWWLDSSGKWWVIKSTSTGENGHFEFQEVSSGWSYRTIIYCDDTIAVKVVNDEGQTYSWATEEFIMADTTYSINISDSARGVWAFYHNVIDEYNWLNDRVGWTRPQVTVYWPKGDSPCSEIPGTIEIPNTGDFEYAIWWRDCALHEYAHTIMYTVYGDGKPPGTGPIPHTIYSESSGGFALREGWAEFMEGAVDNAPWVVSPADLETTVFADGSWTAGEGDFGDWDGNIVEGAVAAIFWDIFDGEDPWDWPLWSFSGYGDYVDNQFNKLWDTLLKKPNDIDDFWLWWSPRDANIWAVFYNQRINKDATPPINPIGIDSSISPGVWTNDTWFWIRWYGAADDLSGVYGYSGLWDNHPLTLPDETVDVDTSAYFESSDPPLTSGNNWYLHIITVDRAGNWNLTAFHIGPFYIDVDAPTIYLSHSPPNPTDADLVNISLSAVDTDSLMASITLYWYNGSWHEGWLFCIPTGATVLWTTHTEKFNPGTILYYATAVDYAGNQKRDPTTGYKSFNVVDDDDAGPDALTPSYDPSQTYIYDYYESYIRFNITWVDRDYKSGISNVTFEFWIDNSYLGSYAPTGNSTDADGNGWYWYDMPKFRPTFPRFIVVPQWMDALGHQIHWSSTAWDNDNDRPNDKTSSSTNRLDGPSIQDDDAEAPQILNVKVVGEFDNEKVKISWELYDRSGLSSVSCTVDGIPQTLQGPYTVGENKGYNVTVDPLPPGTHSFTIDATDNDNDGWLGDTLSSSYSGSFEVYDDDYKPPKGSNPQPPDGQIYLYDYPDSIRINVTWTDESGISEVVFYYRYTDDPSGEWRGVDPTGQTGNTYWYDIPRSEWTQHLGQDIQWYSEAMDSDFDRPNDQLVADFPVPPYSVCVSPPTEEFKGQSPVNIRVTAPNGKRVGYDPITRSTINEIPGATYSGPGSEPQVITIPNPIEGNYTIDAFGIGTGNYTITMRSIASNGTVIDSKVWTGTAKPGEQYTENVRLNADGTILDITPPTITITAPTNGANYTLNQPVTASYSCNDALSGVASCIGTVPSGSRIDTSSVGPKTFTVTATDNAGNTATTTITYNVIYKFGGFLPPLDKGKTYKANSTIPVKFQLTDYNGNYISTAVAQIWIDSTSNPGAPSGGSSTGNYFRYDPTSNQYIFNLSTKGLTTGPHTIIVTLDDGTTHSIAITLN